MTWFKSISELISINSVLIDWTDLNPLIINWFQFLNWFKSLNWFESPCWREWWPTLGIYNPPFRLQCRRIIHTSYIPVHIHIHYFFTMNQIWPCTHQQSSTTFTSHSFYLLIINPLRYTLIPFALAHSIFLHRHILGSGEFSMFNIFNIYYNVIYRYNQPTLEMHPPTTMHHIHFTFDFFLWFDLCDRASVAHNYEAAFRGTYLRFWSNLLINNRMCSKSK